MSVLQSVQVALGIGSNLNRRLHIQRGMDALKRQFGKLDVSPVYRTPAHGFEGPDFFNLVCTTETTLEVGELQAVLKNIEDSEGRVRRQDEILSRTLDIDILLYGDQDLRNRGFDIPRQEILEYPFVLRPLSELLPLGMHPTEKVTFLSLWQNMQKIQPQIESAEWMPTLAQE